MRTTHEIKKGNTITERIVKPFYVQRNIESHNLKLGLVDLFWVSHVYLINFHTN